MLDRHICCVFTSPKDTTVAVPILKCEMLDSRDTHDAIVDTSDHRRWIVWFVVLNLTDGLQTMFIVREHGLHMEANPWIAWWIQEYSFAGLWIVKLTVMVAVLIASGRFPTRVIRSVALALSAIVLSNGITSLGL